MEWNNGVGQWGRSYAIINSTTAPHEGTTEPHHKSGIDMTWVDNKGLIYSAVICAVICCFIAFADLREHLARFDYPKLQVLEMRIIAMIPIYAIFSALSLLFPRWRFFFETVRDTYESFVLYIFFMLMVAYCGGEGQLLRSLKRKRYKGMHPFPMCWLPSFPLDTNFYLRCKRWVLQCALIKPVCSLTAMICHPLGIYVEGSFAVNNVYTYTCIVINVSLTMGLYYLVLFEIECEKEMSYARTFLKFLCIKSIIFFSYWQSVMVSVASMAGILYLGDEEQSENISAIIQDLLMCFELLPVALLHRAAFGRDKLDEEMACVPVYMKDEANTGDVRSNMDTALNVNDIVEDTLGTIFYRRGKLVDQENGMDSDVEEADGYGIGAGGREVAGDAGGASSQAPMNTFGGENVFLGNADAFARDPTLEELVRHAVATDYGVRVDGVRHYDEDSDREECNQDMHFTDTDVILHRSKVESAAQEVRVDTDLLQSHQAQQNMDTPQIYCVVCGRFDREMVRRRNGYKCRECVGTHSMSLLRRKQREDLEAAQPQEAAAAAAAPSKGGMFGFGKKNKATAVVVEDEDHYIQPIREDADLEGVARPTASSHVPADLSEPVAAIADGFANLQNALRQAFQGNSGRSAPPSAMPAARAGPPAASVSPPRQLSSSDIE